MELVESVSKVMHCFKNAKVRCVLCFYIRYLVFHLKRLDDKDCRVSAATLSGQNPRAGKVPEYFQAIIDFENESDSDSPLIVELVNVSKFVEYKKDPSLVLSAVDFNSKDFCLVLAQVLLLSKSIIYIDTHHLTVKGSKRLSALLENFKNLFDSRVLVILISEEETSGKISEFVDKVLDLGQNEKKRKSKSEGSISEVIKKPKSSENDKDMLRISELENEVVELKTLLEKERIESTQKHTMLLDRNDKLEEHLRSIKAINATLEEDCKELNIKLNDKNVENLHLIEENEKNRRDLQIIRVGEQKLKEQVNVSNTDLEDHRLQIRNLKLENKEILEDKERIVKENNLQILQLKNKLDKSEKMYQVSAASHTDHESQTKDVNISDSSITHIVKNIKTNQAKFPHAEPKEILNFKY